MTLLRLQRVGGIQMDELTVVSTKPKQGDSEMCTNCGCGEPDERHQPTDITREDVQRAADGGGLSLAETTKNMTESLAKLASTTRQESTASPRTS